MLSLTQHEGQLWSVSSASESCFSVAPPFETCTIHVSPLFRKPETCSVLCISENISSLDQSPCSSRTSGLSALPPPPVTSTVPGYLNLASPSIALFSIMAFILKPSYTAWDFLWFRHRSVLKTRTWQSHLLTMLTGPSHSLNKHGLLAKSSQLWCPSCLPGPSLSCLRTLVHLFHCIFLSIVTSWFICLPSPQAWISFSSLADRKPLLGIITTYTSCYCKSWVANLRPTPPHCMADLFPGNF